MSDKVYIKMDGGICFKPDGWTTEQADSFIDKMIEVAEGFGSEVQFSMSYQLKTEAELEAES